MKKITYLLLVKLLENWRKKCQDPGDLVSVINQLSFITKYLYKKYLYYHLNRSVYYVVDYRLTDEILNHPKINIHLIIRRLQFKNRTEGNLER